MKENKTKNIKLILLIVCLFLLGCHRNNNKKVVKENFVFGTLIKIVVYNPDVERSQKSIKMAFDEIKRVENKFNSEKKKSLFYRINHNPGKFIKVDKETLYLLKEINKTYKLSSSKYDITLTPLMKTWGFYDQKERLQLPTKEELKKACEKINFNNIEIVGDKIRLKTPVNAIDTGSFLKGYAIHKAKEQLIKAGITSAFITSISSIETINKKPDNKLWKIGLQNPKNPSKILHIIGLNNRSMGVSGDYQTYVEIAGKKYNHLLDIKSGYPIKDRKMVVVIGANSFFTDMYSTAFFTMPISDVLDFVNSKKNLEVMIVKSDMSEVYSSGFKKYILD